MHFLSVKQLNKSSIIHLIYKTNEIRQNIHKYSLGGKTLINYFSEPSTRTSCSFQKAMYNLGGNVINVDEKTSSVQKGENIEDTIQTLNYYGNIIVMRHPLKESLERAAKVSHVPIVNAGNGNGEHPTQALLDIYTIYTELQKRRISITENTCIIISFVGDLKNSRTIHYLIQLLCHFQCIQFYYLCPEGLEMPTDIYNEINEKGFQQQYVSSLNEILSKSDIFYFTRIQKERIGSSDISKYVNIQPYSITMEEVNQMKESSIIMHPFPRLEEVHFEIDSDKRAVYYKQIDNGVYMRMTILHEILNNSYFR